MSPQSREIAVVLSSGGLDSTVCMDIANEDHPAGVIAVSFRYGQKHEAEIKAAERVANIYHAHHIVIDLPKIFAGFGSTIIAADNLRMPHMSYQELHETYGVSPTYVPFRNANLLSMATAVALTNDANEIYAGMHAEDAHNWAYPDCTPEFLGAMANAIYVGSYHKVRLVTPLQWMTKAQVVELGWQRGAPFGETLSCYEGKEPACGKCPTCVGRIQAFKTNHLVDPIAYEIDIDWEE